MLSVTQVLESKEGSIFTVLFATNAVIKSTFNCIYLWNLDNWLLRRSWPFHENLLAYTTIKSGNWRSCFNLMFDFNHFFFYFDSGAWFEFLLQLQFFRDSLYRGKRKITFQIVDLKRKGSSIYTWDFQTYYGNRNSITVLIGNDWWLD